MTKLRLRLQYDALGLQMSLCKRTDIDNVAIMQGWVFVFGWDQEYC
jgi:hypothetical protein